MNFRDDEIIVASSDDSSSDGCNEESEFKIETSITQSSQSQGDKKKTYNTVDDAYALVHTVENKMNEISNVLSSMDKRMAYNLRLISSVTYDCHSKFH
jgi:hypothetical protein